MLSIGKLAQLAETSQTEVPSGDNALLDGLPFLDLNLGASNISSQRSMTALITSLSMNNS